MSREAEVTKAVEAMRADELGLHHTTLAGQKELLEELGTDDPKKGVELLTALLQRLDDTTDDQQHDARALRWALAVDCPPLENVTARRTAARKSGSYYGAVRTQFNAEDRAIKRLVTLIVEEADKRAAITHEGLSAQDAFTRSVRQPIPPEPSESKRDTPIFVPDDFYRWRARRSRVLLATMTALIFADIAPAAFTLGNMQWGPLGLMWLLISSVAVTAILGILVMDTGRKDEKSWVPSPFLKSPVGWLFPPSSRH